MNRYVLDACALLALLKNENGADKVAAVLKASYINEAQVIIHKANLLEVYYDIHRTLGNEAADLILAGINKSPISINPKISDDIFLEAGRLKSKYKISFADSFALAQAIVSDSELLTSDHHEFDVIEKQNIVRFIWIK